MKLILIFVVSCFVLGSGEGAPRTAVYKFVRCNPEGDQANCVTLQSPEMAWTPDLPAKLPASTAQYLEAEPVEDESSLEEGDVEDEEEMGEVEEEEEEEEGEEGEEGEEEETLLTSEEGESPPVFLSEDGSGAFEGSAAGAIPIADVLADETGSGESWTMEDVEQSKIVKSTGMRRLFPSMYAKAKPADQEMREDHLLLHL